MAQLDYDQVSKGGGKKEDIKFIISFNNALSKYN